MDRKTMIMLASVTLTLLACGVTLAVALSLQGQTDAGEFPAATLRTAKVPPPFELENQLGEKVKLEDFRGQIVMLTAVYASCHTACPTIITKAKSAVGKLTPEQRDQVAIVAISLDPEGDSRDKRASAAKTHGLEPPLFHYVNGADPQVVLKLLDDLGWARAVAGDTGVIGHSNLFLLVDREGKIAYTVSADGDTDWLDQSLETLLAE